MSDPIQKEVLASSPAWQFTTTRWSVVLEAGREETPRGQEALEVLCRAYWYPLYAYVRHQGYDVEEAQDLTQDFFARFLEKKYFGLADPARGRFRSFLLTSLKHFLVNEWRKSKRQKRVGAATVEWGGASWEQRYQSELVDPMAPDVIYERRWALTLLQRVLGVLRQECEAAGKGRLFDELKGCLWGDNRPAPYREIAQRTELSEGAIKVAAFRLRQRYRDLLRAEVAQTVGTPGEVDEELRHLIQVMNK